MSKVKIEGHGTGTGTFTVTTPSSNTDRTITLPDATGTLLNSDGDGSSLTGVADATKLPLAGGTLTGNVTVSASGADASRTLSLQGTNGSSELYQFNLIADGGNSAAKFMIGSGGGAASEKLRIQSGGGISFNGDTAAANALDDYEEGNWTPTWSPTGGSWSGTGVGKYTKIGRQVTASFKWVASGQATGSKFNAVGGLPFTCLNETTTYVASVSMNGGGASGHSLTATLNPNQTEIYLQMQPDSTSAHGEFTPSQTASNCTFNLTITYMTA